MQSQNKFTSEFHQLDDINKKLLPFHDLAESADDIARSSRAEVDILKKQIEVIEEAANTAKKNSNISTIISVFAIIVSIISIVINCLFG